MATGPVDLLILRHRVGPAGRAATEASMIAFLGTGLLGSGFVRALRRRGEPVQVWNRTPSKAEALAADGAVPCQDPPAAARGAARVHLTLSDDVAVDDVLEQAWPGLAPGAVIVDHTTTSPAGTAARAARWAGRGVPFQHAPVFMGPQQALEGTGIMLASGERSRFEALAPALQPMTGKLVWLGPQPERAAGMKLLGNLFLMAMTTGLIDALALAKGLGIPPDEAGALFDHFNPGAFVPARMKRILAGDFEHPSWELGMARKDARLMLEAAQAGGVPLAVVPAIAAEMDRFLAEGLAHSDWTVMAKGLIR
jgi:3-hydroxyisobutyrate dehydrogenase